MSAPKKYRVLVLLILAGETIFFLPFVLARIFRPTLLAVFDISNFELGTYFSAYGIVAMASYFFGGPLADRFPSRNLLSLGLWATGLGGLVMAMIPASSAMKILYAFWGFTTIFLFWAALIRTTREWGGTDFQGRAFGFLEGGRGLTAALLGSFALLIFSNYMPDQNLVSIEERNQSFKIVVYSTSFITVILGLLIMIYVPKSVSRIDTSEELFSVRSLLQIIKMPLVWMQAIIIVCAYVGYKITDDYSLYANEVLGFDEVESAAVGTTAMWMRPLFAVLAGILADRIAGIRVIIYCFITMVIGGLLIGSAVLNGLVIPALIMLAVSLVGVYGLRAIYFAIMQDAKIPITATGTAVGIMSVLGYAPDVFISPLMGYLLDSNPGSLGHQHVFLVMTAFSALGLITSLTFMRRLGLNQQKKTKK